MRGIGGILTEYRKNRVCSGYVGNGDLHGEAAILAS